MDQLNRNLGSGRQVFDRSRLGACVQIFSPAACLEADFKEFFLRHGFFCIRNALMQNTGYSVLLRHSIGRHQRSVLIIPALCDLDHGAVKRLRRIGHFQGAAGQHTIGKVHRRLVVCLLVLAVFICVRILGCYRPLHEIIIVSLAIRCIRIFSRCQGEIIRCRKRMTSLEQLCISDHIVQLRIGNRIAIHVYRNGLLLLRIMVFLMVIPILTQMQLIIRFRVADDKFPVVGIIVRLHAGIGILLSTETNQRLLGKCLHKQVAIGCKLNSDQPVWQIICIACRSPGLLNIVGLAGIEAENIHQILFSNGKHTAGLITVQVLCTL